MASASTSAAAKVPIAGRTTSRQAGWSSAVTLGMCLQVSGGWACSAVVEFCDRPRGSSRPRAPSHISLEWFYDGRWGPLAGRQPANGETVGLFVCAGDCRNTTEAINKNFKERSNVVLVPWSNGGGTRLHVPNGSSRVWSLKARSGLGIGAGLFAFRSRYDGFCAGADALSLCWSQARRVGAIVGCLSLLALASCSETPSELTPPTPDPPSLTCPANVEVASTDGKPLAVTYSTPTVVGECSSPSRCRARPQAERRSRQARPA